MTWLAVQATSWVEPDEVKVEYSEEDVKPQARACCTGLLHNVAQLSAASIWQLMNTIADAAFPRTVR